MTAKTLSTALAAILLAASPALAQTVGIGTGPQGTPTNAAGAAIAKVVNESSGYQTRAVPQTATEHGLPLLERGSLELVVTNIMSVDAARDGTEMFAGRKHEKLRMVGRLYPLQVGLVVRKDSPIKVAAELRGKRFPVGYTAQQSVVVVFEAMLANAGLSPKDVAGVPVPNTDRGTEDFMQGKADGAFMALGAARMQRVDAAVGGVRVLGLDTSSEGLARMMKVLPPAYPIAISPSPTNYGVLQPISVMAYDFVLVTSAQVPEEVIYRVAKAMYEGKASLAATFAAYRDFEPEKFFASYAGHDYHPGAVKYFRERGLKPAS